MPGITLPVDPTNPDPAVIARAAAVLRAGGLVAFPTETVYGLGAHALDASAVRRIYAAKGRPAYNPLIVHVADADAARALSGEWPALASRLAHQFWPGPLTLVVRKRDDVPDEVTAGLDSVALRVPQHPVALALLRAASIPVAAPSANPSSALSPTSARHVERALAGRVDLILDAGATTVGIESTVVDVRGERAVLLRPGTIDLRELEAIAGPLALPTATQPEAAPRPSPGMLDRHYAPRARVLLFDHSDAATVAADVRRLLERGERVGGLVLNDLGIPNRDLVRMPPNAADYARALYEVLHALDDAGCHLIVIERVPSGPEWQGIRDRLERASR